MPVPVTLLYGGLCGLLLFVLSIYVSMQRGRHKAGIGQIPPELVRPVRAHGNAAENVPIGVILLLALELSGVSSQWLHVFGGGFVLGRSLHAVGMITKTPVSAIGIALSHGAILSMSILALWRHFYQ